MQNALRQLTGQATVPNVFVGGRHVGGFDKTLEARKSGLLSTLVAETEGTSFLAYCVGHGVIDIVL